MRRWWWPPATEQCVNCFHEQSKPSNRNDSGSFSRILTCAKGHTNQNDQGDEYFYTGKACPDFQQTFVLGIMGVSLHDLDPLLTLGHDGVNFSLKIKPEVIDWIQQSIPQTVIELDMFDVTFTFASPKDAALFKLFWC